MPEVFGYLIDDYSPEALRHRRDRLCPFGNRVPSCTKDKIKDPLGVCSIYHGERVAITCPVRFREGWKIASDAAEFFFSQGEKWTALQEVRLNDADGRSAGNIDVVLASYDDQGELIDFGSLEVQAVYISGNIRNPFAAYMQNHDIETAFTWIGESYYPRADFLSSSRKRLAPQLIYKGGILHAWGKKMAVAVDEAFFSELPELPQVEPPDADVAWFVYNLIEDVHVRRYSLIKVDTVYTQFSPVLREITQSNPGPEKSFRVVIQRRLKAKQASEKQNNAASTIVDLFASGELDSGYEANDTVVDRQ